MDDELDEIIGLGEGEGLEEELDSPESEVDVLSMATDFISQNQLDRAITLLQPALQQQPEDGDLRLKLAEALAEKGHS